MKRSVAFPLLVMALALLAGLTVSALEPMQIRAYALGAPNSMYVAFLARGQEACEGPIRVQSAVGGLRIWGSGAGGRAWVEVSVRNATSGRVIARGWTLVQPTQGDHDVALNTPIPPGSTIGVCVTGQGASPLALNGSAAANPGIVMSPAPKMTPTEFSVVLFERSRHSLLAALPTAFARAALFRFSWTGPWTFWVLAVAFLATIATSGWAVAAAARADGLVEATPPKERAATPLALHPHD